MKYALAPIVTFAFVLSVSCSQKPAKPGKEAGSATKSQNASGESATATLADSTESNKITVKSGTLKDASVIVPPGSLSVDTSVSIKQGKSPKAFKVKKAKKASAPLVVSASRDDIKKTSAGGSLKISIPINRGVKPTDLGLFMASNINNKGHSKLAALLQDRDGNLIIWRRPKIAVVNGHAIFKSKRFGTYQLVILGSDQATEFTDTSEDAPEEKMDEDPDEDGDGNDNDNDNDE